MPVGRPAYERTMILCSRGVKVESPVVTPHFFGHIFPVFLVSYGRYVFEKICHRLLVGGQWKLRCLLALASMHVRTLLLLMVYAWCSSPG